MSHTGSWSIASLEADLESRAREAAASGIPDDMIPALVRYIVHHAPVGDFLRAVLANDLLAACARADDANATLLFRYVAFLYHCAPRDCWGSPAHVEAWLREGEP